MIECNLRIIMAKKKLTASKVSNDTRISRVTLGALIHNQADGVQFRTLDKLCRYLDCTIADLLEYHPDEN